MIRVVHVIRSLHHSGTARQLALLAARLPRDEFEVQVVTLESGCEQEAASPFSAAPRSVGRRMRFDPAALWRLRRMFAEFQPHVVHAWEGTAHNFARLALGKSRNRRLVATETHCRSLTRLERWFEQRLIERTAWMIVGSPALAEACSKAGFDRVWLIPWGVEPPPERPFDRAAELSAFDIPADARVAGYVGELTRERRGRDLVWGINLLSQITSRVCLLAMGDGSEREKLQSFAREIRREEFVRLPGEGDGRGAMRLFDLYWSMGDEESPSSALLESMAVGIPAIVSDTPAHRELVIDGETGFVVGVGDAVGLAQFSDRLLADPERRRAMGEAARARALAEFCADRMAETHAELYRSLAAEIGE
ncbi:MAG: glycosyltransferase [Planctomycetaceae bacterium]